MIKAIRGRTQYLMGREEVLRLLVQHPDIWLEWVLSPSRSSAQRLAVKLGQGGGPGHARRPCGVMTARDWRMRVEDMLDAIAKITRYSKR